MVIMSAMPSSIALGIGAITAVPATCTAQATRPVGLDLAGTLQSKMARHGYIFVQRTRRLKGVLGTARAVLLGLLPVALTEAEAGRDSTPRRSAFVQCAAAAVTPVMSEVAAPVTLHF